jgi:hypothetical protein
MRRNIERINQQINEMKKCLTANFSYIALRCAYKMSLVLKLGAERIASLSPLITERKKKSEMKRNNSLRNVLLKKRIQLSVNVKKMETCVKVVSG